MLVTEHVTKKDQQAFMTEWMACWIAFKLEKHFHSWDYYATRH